MKRLLIIVSIGLLTNLNANAQNQEATTSDGKKVILNNDGTWTYKADKKESKSVEKTTHDCKYWKDEVDEFTGDIKNTPNRK